MICRLRTRPPVFEGHSPPTLTQRIRIKDSPTAPCHGAHHLGGGFAVAEDPMPDFEVDEQPEAIAVRFGSGPMLLDELPQAGAIVEASRLGPRREDELVDHPSEAVAQPAADGHGKPHLRPRED